MVYESDFYTSRRGYSRPSVPITSYTINPKLIPAVGKAHTYHPSIPYIAHKRMNNVTTPVPHNSVRKTVIDNTLDRIYHKPRAHPSYDPMEDFLNERSVTSFEDVSRSIRANTAALLKKIHTPIPRAIRPLSISNQYDHIETPISERISSDEYIWHLLRPLPGRQSNGIEVGYYPETSVRIPLGKTHLACLSYAGSHPISKRRQLIAGAGDDYRNVRNDVELLSHYNKMRAAASHPFENGNVNTGATNADAGFKSYTAPTAQHTTEKVLINGTTNLIGKDEENVQKSLQKGLKKTFFKDISKDYEDDQGSAQKTENTEALNTVELEGEEAFQLDVKRLEEEEQIEEDNHIIEDEHSVEKIQKGYEAEKIYFLAENRLTEDPLLTEKTELEEEARLTEEVRLEEEEVQLLEKSRLEEEACLSDEYEAEEPQITEEHKVKQEYMIKEEYRTQQEQQDQEMEAAEEELAEEDRLTEERRQIEEEQRLLEERLVEEYHKEQERQAEFERQYAEELQRKTQKKLLEEQKILHEKLLEVQQQQELEEAEGSEYQESEEEREENDQESVKKSICSSERSEDEQAIAENLEQEVTEVKKIDQHYTRKITISSSINNYNDNEDEKSGSTDANSEISEVDEKYESNEKRESELTPEPKIESPEESE